MGDPRPGSMTLIRVAALVVLSAMLTPALHAAEPAKPIWLAVCGADLAAAIAPLAEHRRRDGFDARVSVEAPAAAIAALPRQPAFVLLVGDDEPGAPPAGWHVPAPRKKLYRWRAAQAQDFAADASLGDLNGDGIPEIPVGRIPFRRPDEVAAVVRKTLAFEARPASEADLSAALWSGSPEYGAAIDALATGMLIAMVDTGAPQWTTPSVVAGDPRHALCGWPPEQVPVFAARMKSGLLSVMLGHSSEEHFFSMSHGQTPVVLTAATARPHLEQDPPGPPCVMFTCLAGNFSRPAPCLAEGLLKLPGGPAAVVAATTESHPLTNYLVGKSLLPAIQSGPKRLGAVWLEAQRAGHTARDLLIENILGDVEGKLEPQINHAKLRRDQLSIYGILGDPATRLPMPETLVARITPTDDGWKWTAERPVGAESIEVGHRAPLGAFTPREPLLPTATEAEQAAARQAAEEANARFAFRPLPAPAKNAPWEGVLRERGVLRLVAKASGRLYVAAFKLEK